VVLEPDIGGVSIVLIGSMNPSIFSPDWFARQGLISSAQADDADVEILHRSIVQFKTGWLSVIVDRQRFQVMTTEPPYIRICDFVVRLFRECLPHAPISVVGINRDYHFNVSTAAAREKIGRALAPPTAWGEWGEKFSSGEGEKHGGLRSIIMEYKNLDDRAHGHIHVRVEPSQQLLPWGVYIGINDHFDASALPAEEQNVAVLSFLEKNFDASMARAESLADQVLRLKDA